MVQGVSDFRVLWKNGLESRFKNFECDLICLEGADVEQNPLRAMQRQERGIGGTSCLTRVLFWP